MKFDGLEFSLDPRKMIIFGWLWFQTILYVIRTPRIFNIGGVIRHVNDFFCSIVFSLISNRIQNFEKFNFPSTDSTVWIGWLETSSYFPFIKGTDPDCYFNRTHSLWFHFSSISFSLFLFLVRNEKKGWCFWYRRSDSNGGVYSRDQLLPLIILPLSASPVWGTSLEAPTRQFYWSNVILHIFFAYIIRSWFMTHE